MELGMKALWIIPFEMSKTPTISGSIEAEMKSATKLITSNVLHIGKRKKLSIPS